LRTAKSGTAPVVWSGCLSETEALRFLQAGASGVVRKTIALEELLSCLQTVAGGGTWMEGDLALHAAHTVRTNRSALTSREQQVMDLIERGYKNKEIALALGIRTGTVKIHLKHIFEKTGIRGRYGLAISGLKQKGLLALPAA
jgi:DNA-binding NarL/FixJ family response regulator